MSDEEFRRICAWCLFGLMCAVALTAIGLSYLVRGL